MDYSHLVQNLSGVHRNKSVSNGEAEVDAGLPASNTDHMQGQWEVRSTVSWDQQKQQCFQIPAEVCMLDFFKVLKTGLKTLQAKINRLLKAPNNTKKKKK